MDGSYSIQLPEGVAYTFNVSAFVDGYVDESATVGPLTGNTTQDFALDADVVACNAPGYGFQGGFIENFASVTPPALPANGPWLHQWHIRQLGNQRQHCTSKRASPHSSPNLAYFNSYSASSGYSTRLYRTTAVNMTTLANTDLTLWMYHDMGYTSNDRVQVQVSTDGGTTWANVGTAISRYTGSTGWRTYG